VSHPRPFRFGVQVSNAPSRSAWVELARKVEDLGFSSLLLPDHFGDQLAPVPAMMAAADATTGLRVGALVLDNDYKHPVVLAKELATIDVLSEGRLEVGIGAGWMIDDYEQSGIAYDEPKVRVDRLEEGLAVLKGCFADGPFSFDGTHYQITGLDGRPLPVQRPHPPILIGGGGKRMLGIAAREADIVGLNPNLKSGRLDATTAADASPARFDEKSAWLKAAAGDRYDHLEINCLVFAVMVTDDAKASGDMLAGFFGTDSEQIHDVPLALIGSEDTIVDHLHARRERWGMSYVVVQADTLDAMAPIVARLAGT
jgi:probable F420-dependent oxidoreductase